MTMTSFTSGGVMHQGYLWEPMEGVKQMAAPNFEIHGVGHWFIEDDKPDHFVPEAANMAWSRTLDFLGKS